jgi:hypothetical protein
MRIDVQDLGPADRIKFYLQYETLADFSAMKYAT